MNLVKKIQENIFRHQLFGRGAKVVVGVSGGPDSVCLLDVLYKLKNKYDLEIIVAHVNYGLRGKDSEKDEALVKKLAEKYSLPIEIMGSGKWEVGSVQIAVHCPLFTVHSPLPTSSATRPSSPCHRVSMAARP